jgi:hypothetical protein
VTRTGTQYLWAIVALTAIAVGALVTLEVCHVPTDRGLVAQVFGIVLPTLTGLLALLRSQANNDKLNEVKQQVQQHAATVNEKLDTAARLTESKEYRP